MEALIEIAPDRRGGLAGLFANHQRVRMVVEAILEGRFGVALADSEEEPSLAQLRLMTMFHVFGGDAEHPLAREALGSLQKGIVLLASDDWRELLFEIHGGRIMAQPRTALSSATLDVERLRALARRVPPGFQVQRIDADMARRMSGELEDQVTLHAFRSPEDFAERGIGFATLYGERIVCVATSFVVCSRGIEIQIVTHADFRRRGLATATSAALMAHCLEHDLEPEWDADNPESLKLAQKLGYSQPQPYQWLIVLPE